MAPLPVNLTDRYFIDYTTGRVEHTFQVRCTPGFGDAAIDAAISVFLTQLETVLPNTWLVLRSRVSRAGSTLTFPVELPLTDDFQGAGGTPFPPVNEPLEAVFVGRGRTSGRRVELSLYGVKWSVPDDYRIESGADGPATAALEALNAGGSNIFVTAAGDAALWYPYVNLNFNSYWERRARLGL